MISEDESTNQESGGKNSNEVTNKRLVNKLKKLHTSYNSTSNDMVDYAFIGVTD